MLTTLFTFRRVITLALSFELIKYLINLQVGIVSEMDDTQDVKLHVYDLTKGLACSLSPMLLGMSYPVISAIQPVTQSKHSHNVHYCWRYSKFFF